MHSQKSFDHTAAKVESIDNEFHPHVVLVENKYDLMGSLYLTEILGGNDKSKIYPNLVSFKLGCYFTLLSHKRLSETLQ